MQKTRTYIDLGTEKIGSLLVKQSVPAAIGFFVMVIYQVVDTIFVGRGVGTLAIAGITVVMPISMLIATIGLSLGVGGSSIISRALGAGENEKAQRTFGNLITLTLSMVLFTTLMGFVFQDEVLWLFGGKGDIYPFALDYFQVLLPGLPFLAFAMMANNAIRAEGNAKAAMLTMLIPAIINIILDPIFIFGFGWGIKGAAFATTISYIFSAGYALFYFLSGRSPLKVRREYLPLEPRLVKEIFAIGITSMARQGSASLLAVVLNHTLFTYGAEIAVAIYGILFRVLMFSFFPVMGLLQGFLPISGFNYGAQKFGRVLESLRLSISTATAICFGLLVLVMLFANPIVKLFSDDPELILPGAKALRMVFIAVPLVATQLFGAAYFQAIGKALPALLLTMTRQGIFLIPLVLILPVFWELNGVWLAFPISDFLAMVTTSLFLFPQWKKLKAMEAEGLKMEKEEMVPEVA